MKILATYLATAVIFLGVDLLWLGVIAKGFYNRQIGPLLADNVSVPPAIAFYLLYVGAILYFAVMPGIEEKSLLKAAANGAFLGAVAYGAYELTNLATLKNWPLPITLVDLAWGIILTTVAACAGYLVLRWLQ